MSYRARLQATQESVQDLTLAAQHRLDEAEQLLYAARHHTAIYLAGLAAEMYLKSAIARLRGATLATPIEAVLEPIRRAHRRGPLARDLESGHGLWFWSQILLQDRAAFGRTTTNRLHKSLLTASAALFANWFVAMRYRPGSASQDDALAFLTTAEWFKANHGALMT